MTPEQRAERWLRARGGHEMWVRQEIPLVAALIREAVADERKRCAQIVARSASDTGMGVAYSEMARKIREAKEEE